MTEYTNSYSLSNELVSFKKSISSNNREAIEKYLTHIKNLSQEFLNQALFWCIQNHKVQNDECLHLLIRYTSQNSKSKANLNCQINFQTPLIAACKKGQLSLVKRLIENGAKPDFSNSQNKHPLQFILMSRQQNYDVAEYLISQMQNVNFLINNKHPILISIEREFHRVFKSLLQKGSEIQFQDGNLLHFIMKQKFRKLNKKKKFLKQMTNKYALFTQVDKNGKMPIQYQENEEIKAYYAQNFKIKKIPQPLLNSVQKISNNSSIFINLKPNRKDVRSTVNQRKKNIAETGQGANKNLRDGNKDHKYTGKQEKNEEGSFQDYGDDKQDSQINEEQDKPSQKQTKMNSQSFNLKDSKKLTSTNLKGNLNSSFILNKQSSIVSKEQSNLTNTSTKFKSKYSSIGPKTQTYLKNYTTSTKRTNDNLNKIDTKKVSGGSNVSGSNIIKDSGNIKKKKSSFQDEKREMGSSKKISVSQVKASTKELKNKQQKYDENQKQQNSQMQNKLNETFDDQSPSMEESHKLTASLNLNQIKQVDDELLKIETQKMNQKNQSNEEIESQKQSEQMINMEPQKISEWEMVLQTCQKLMEQFIIKQESEITHLNELKQKLDEVFSKYQNQHSKSQNEIKFSDSQKLKQIKLSNNHVSNKPKNNNNSQNSRKNCKSSKQPLNINISTKNPLSQQISSIEFNCQNSGKKKSDCIFDAIQMISKKVQLVLQSSRKQKIEVSIETYGSRANGLQTQTSDIDLLIVCNINSGVKDLMLQLQRSGAFKCSQINEAKFLVNTSMPIMKLALNSSYMHMNIDLTFQVRGHTGLRCTSLIKQFIAAEELLKPLVVTLKTLLGHYDLCDTYTGGVGSYSLTLMTIALLQFTEIKKTRQNLGDIFLEFLLFYGFQMDYVCQAIIIHPPGFNERPAFSIYQLPYTLDLTPKLIIYDPLNPVNNVGRATYRIVQLKKLFKIWYVKLRTELYGAKDGIQRLMSMKDQLLERTTPV